MTSLTEVYEGGTRGANLRRLYVGVGLFLVGAALAVAGIVVGASSAVATVVGGVYAARELAGVLGGVGLPLAFLGVVVVLPQASMRLRAAAVAGLVVAVAGVVLFVWAYPRYWYGGHPDYTLPITALYFLGAVTSLWCLFTAVANFKTRNDPGGTVRLEITKEGRTKVVEVSNDDLRQRLGGIGLLGGTPDGNVETQTNRPDRPSRAAGSAPVSDGGATTADDAEFLSGPAPGSADTRSDAGSAPESASVSASTPASARGFASDPGAADIDTVSTTPGPRGDRYCGNCDHFKYVRTTDGDMRPYCGFHGEAMDDMEPCQQWEPNV